MESAPPAPPSLVLPEEPVEAPEDAVVAVPPLELSPAAPALPPAPPVAALAGSSWLEPPLPQAATNNGTMNELGARNRMQNMLTERKPAG